MKKHYDKLVLLLSVLILIGGVAYSLTFESVEGKVDSQMNESKLGGEPYEPISAPVVRSRVVSWDEPPYQNPSEEAWRFAVFTPPKIYVDPQSGELIEEPPVPPPPPEPFGLRLVELSHPLYPITLEAYFESATGDPKDAAVNLYHHELQKSSGIRSIGDKLDEWGVTIESLDVQTITAPDGGIETVAVVTLKDQKLDRVFKIKPGERIVLDDINRIRVETTHPAGSGTRWEATGDTFAHGEAKYELMEIDFDKMSITVEKESPNLKEPETLTLELVGGQEEPTSSSGRTSAPNNPSQQRKPTPAPAANDPFQGLFN